MKKNEVRQKIQGQIISGFFDPHTFEHSGHDIVTFYREDSGEQATIRATLESVVRDITRWDSPEQLENAFYFSVNLQSVEALQKLVEAAGEEKDYEKKYANLAIAAIRTFPYKNADYISFIDPLRSWLRSETASPSAFEALSDISPDSVTDYAYMAFHYHSHKPEILQKILTHLYFHENNPDKGLSLLLALLRLTESKINFSGASENHPLSTLLIESQTALQEAIRVHPLLPSEVKETLQKKESRNPDRDRSYKRFELIIKHTENDSTHAVGYLDLDGIIVDVNNMACSLLGRSRKDTIDRHYKDFTTLIGFGIADERTRRTKIGEGKKLTPRYQVEVIRGDNSTVTFECRTTNVYDKIGGEHIGFRSEYYDITERKIGEDALSQIPDYAYSFSIARDGSILCENISPGFAKATGFAPESLRSIEAWKAIVHPDDSAVFGKIEESLSLIRSDVSEFRILP